MFGDYLLGESDLRWGEFYEIGERGICSLSGKDWIALVRLVTVYKSSCY